MIDHYGWVADTTELTEGDQSWVAALTKEERARLDRAAADMASMAGLTPQVAFQDVVHCLRSMGERP